MIGQGLHSSKHLTEHVHGDWKDDRAIVLRRDVVQCLQISQLERKQQGVYSSDMTQLYSKGLKGDLPHFNLTYDN